MLPHWHNSQIAKLCHGNRLTIHPTYWQNQTQTQCQEWGKVMWYVWKLCLHSVLLTIICLKIFYLDNKWQCYGKHTHTTTQLLSLVSLIVENMEVSNKFRHHSITQDINMTCICQILTSLDIRKYCTTVCPPTKLKATDTSQKPEGTAWLSTKH
jgi:hypothetical protein